MVDITSKMDAYVKQSEADLAYYFDLKSLSEPKLYSVLTNDEDRITCALRWMLEGGHATQFTEMKRKLSKTAIEWIENGNVEFKKKEMSVAWFTYTRAIMFACPKSNELARGYANRSAALWELNFYEPCLNDIDRALSIGYPGKLKAKLYMRRLKCLLKLHNNSSPEVNQAIADTNYWIKKLDQRNQDALRKALDNLLKSHFIPNLADVYDPHEKMPTSVSHNVRIVQASNAIELKYTNDKYGRQVVAARSVDAGEVLMLDEAFISMPTLNSNCECHHTDFVNLFCWNCAKRGKSCIPCDFCIFGVFCDEKCRDEAWNDHHEVECSAISALMRFGPSHEVLMSLKMTVKALKQAGGIGALRDKLMQIDTITDPIAKFFVDGVFDSRKYTSVYPLLVESPENPVPFAVAVESARTLICLARHTTILGKKIIKVKDILDHKWTTFIGALILRNQKIALNYRDEQYLYQLVPETMLASEGEPRSSVIMPLMSLCNHSCDSNVYIQSQGNLIALRAVERIRKGEQIFLTYKQLYFLTNPRDNRRKILQEHYNFFCECPPCLNNWCFPRFKSYQNFPLSQDVLKKLNRVVGNLHSTIWIKVTNQEEYDKRMKSLLKIINVLSEHVRNPCFEVTFVKEYMTGVFKLYSN